MNKILCLLVLSFSLVNECRACKDCFDSIAIQRKSTDAILDRFIRENTFDESASPDWLRGFRAGTKLGLEQSLKVLNLYHSDTKLTLEEWETITQKKAEETDLQPAASKDLRK